MTIFRIRDKWYVKVISQGKRYTGSRGYTRKDDAIAEQVKIKEHIKMLKPHKHLFFATEFFVLWQRYMAHCKEWNTDDWWKIKGYIGKRFFRKWNAKDVREITPAEIEAHLIERKGRSVYAANMDFGILRHFFNWCINMGILDKTPLRPLRRFPVGKKVRPIPSKEEIEKLIGSNTGHDQLLILLLVYTLGRISEIRKLQWQDIDLTKRVIYLRNRKTRDGSEKIREIPIAGRLLAALIACHKESGPVLSFRNRPYKDLRKKLHNCLTNAGLNSNGFHQFRHYGATTLADSGAPINVIQDILGHSSLDTTNIYLQSLRESKRKAMEVL